MVSPYGLGTKVIRHSSSFMHKWAQCMRLTEPPKLRDSFKDYSFSTHANFSYPLISTRTFVYKR